MLGRNGTRTRCGQWAAIGYGTPAGGSAGVASCRLSEAPSAEAFRTSAKWKGRLPAAVTSRQSSSFPQNKHNLHGLKDDLHEFNLTFSFLELYNPKRRCLRSPPFLG